MLRPNRYGLRVTEFHLLDTTAVFLVERNRRIVGTATLIADSDLGPPLDSLHPEITCAARRRGLKLGEAASLATCDPRRLFDPQVFIGLTRLMAQCARAHGIRQVVAGCIPQHASFYCRFPGYERIGPARPFPMVCGTLAVACRLVFAQIDRCRPERYDRCFGEPIPRSALINSPMTELERGAFARVIERARRCRQRAA